MQGVGGPEGLQVEAAEMPVTEETVPVDADDVQVAEEEVQVMADPLTGQNGQGRQDVESGLAAATQAGCEQAGRKRRAGEEDEGMEYETDSDCVSISDSQSLGGDLYSVEDIDGFLEETFGQSVKVTDYFPDPEKFLKSAITIQKRVGLDVLDERKRFSLRKRDRSQENVKKSERKRVPDEENSGVEQGQ